MLSTDIRQESMVKIIENIVSILMEEYPLFKEDLNYAEMVQNLVPLPKNLSFEEFNAMSNNELKEYSSSIMAIKWEKLVNRLLPIKWQFLTMLFNVNRRYMSYLLDTNIVLLLLR